LEEVKDKKEEEIKEEKKPKKGLKILIIILISLILIAGLLFVYFKFIDKEDSSDGNNKQPEVGENNNNSNDDIDNNDSDYNDDNEDDYVEGTEENLNYAAFDNKDLAFVTRVNIDHFNNLDFPHKTSYQEEDLKEKIYIENNKVYVYLQEYIEDYSADEKYRRIHLSDVKDPTSVIYAQIAGGDSYMFIVLCDDGNIYAVEETALQDTKGEIYYQKLERYNISNVIGISLLENYYAIYNDLGFSYMMLAKTKDGEVYIGDAENIDTKWKESTSPIFQRFAVDSYQPNNSYFEVFVVEEKYATNEYIYYTYNGKRPFVKAVFKQLSDYDDTYVVTEDNELLKTKRATFELEKYTSKKVKSITEDSFSSITVKYDDNTTEKFEIQPSSFGKFE